ncbi:hypothetical protein Moror_12283 [Moniliophthora roreri MCA 2997]|uniref:Uncharacterized protein n=2 Tax=Moniliophthora roreri TaxID=221103 RepID=V2WQI8_MONRO|nr:hypothetical protein Moror_12283 [Moniliophthora roreri MCA 2997]
MKSFAALLTTLAVTASALGQGITIGYPKDGDSFKRGETIKFRVETERAWDVSQIGIGIGIQKCQYLGGAGDKCFYNTSLGKLLYKGKFEPYETDGRPELKYHDTFDVKIPDDFEKGKAVISVVHLALVGESSDVQYDTVSVNIDVK